MHKILPNVFLSSKKLLNCNVHTPDTLEDCLDRNHFLSYPYKIEYNFNSRGFRDAEWPDSVEELKNCIWCFGDSYTVGWGSPIEHTWVNILQEKTNKRCINVSMDGASNRWIMRKVLDVYNSIQPLNIVIHWSFITRDEIDDETLPDENRRINHADTVSLLPEKTYMNNFIECASELKNIKNSSIVQSTFEGSGIFDHSVYADLKQCYNRIKDKSWPDFPTDQMSLRSLSSLQYNEFNQFTEADTLQTYFRMKSFVESQNIIYTKKQDLARDGLHYDKKSATDLVDNILLRLKIG